MFTKRLFRFQEMHEENLLKKCADNNQMILSAPTGSGKTVLASKFIDDYFDENPNTVFLWLCPGAGGLEKQSQESFEESTSGIQTGDVYDFINDSNPSGKVFFINWDKINRASNTVLREGERKNLMERVSQCHQDGISIFMIVDEEQRFHDAAERFINDMAPAHVLRISATPVSVAPYSEIITDDEVIAAGLIASSISINEGVSAAIEENNRLDDDLRLIELADKKRKEILAEYQSRGLNIRPLVLIQFPNGMPEWIERVKRCLADLGYDDNSGLVTSWFSGDHPDDVDEIKKLDGQYAFVLFKQAIATGWDCPRAKILVKLREGGTEAFNIQTIGRIRRMPERHHYENDLLDMCYVYTLDNKFKTGLTDSVSASFYSYLYKKKADAPHFNLTKECLDGSDRYAINPEAVVKVIYRKFLEKYDFDNDGVVTKEDLHTRFGFVFDTKLKTTAFEGVARTTKDIKNLNAIFGGEHQISNHDDGFIIRDAKRRIARALNIDENISNNALRILFGPYEKFFNIFSSEEIDFENQYKLIPGLNLREFNAFLINNKDLLIELFSDIKANEIAEIEETAVLTMAWDAPATQYYKMHKRLGGRVLYERNIFEEYRDNITIEPNRYHSERLFESYCEHSDTIKWVYKNGDKGMQFFSIVYKMAFGRANFYPDYIVELKDGTVWVIEAKGGVSSDGQSMNIDSVAKNKFEALKDYALRYNNIKWGFVRCIGNSLMLSNTEWTEDMYNVQIWRPIEDFIR